MQFQQSQLGKCSTQFYRIRILGRIDCAPFPPITPDAVRLTSNYFRSKRYAIRAISVRMLTLLVIRGAFDSLLV